ncbi:MAG: hypothetical protein Q7S00_02445 [bacterium]|nr:hypothetical protein [bacterium]
MKQLFLLNPYAGYNLEKDSSHLLMLEAFRRGHSVFYGVLSRFFVNDGPKIFCSPVESVIPKSPYFHFKKEEAFSLDHFDQIWMRQDPPWNLAYYYATLMLSMAPPSVKIFNAPLSLRDFNEKMSILFFPDFIPASCVSASLSILNDFRKKQPEGIVIKPLDSYAGKGVERILPGDPEADKILRKTTHEETLPVMAQRYLPAVQKGEKRVFLWKGQVLGTLLKIPPPNGFLTSPDLGGRLAKTTLTPAEMKLSQTVGGTLFKAGVWFGGIDIIDGYLTEINVTSPGLLWELNELYGCAFEKQIMDDLEKAV